MMASGNAMMAPGNVAIIATIAATANPSVTLHKQILQIKINIPATAKRNAIHMLFSRRCQKIIQISLLFQRNIVTLPMTSMVSLFFYLPAEASAMTVINRKRHTHAKADGRYFTWQRRRERDMGVTILEGVYFSALFLTIRNFATFQL